MSRSRRKTPIFDNTITRTDKWLKQISARRERRSNKVMIVRGEALFHSCELDNSDDSSTDDEHCFDPDETEEIVLLNGMPIKLVGTEDGTYLLGVVDVFA
jgi:hypothetical protein